MRADPVDACVERLQELLTWKGAGRVVVSVVAGPPPVLVVEGRDGVVLAIEVGGQGKGLGDHSAAGVPEVWHVDLDAHAVTVHQHPGGGGYGEARTHRPGRLLAVPGLAPLAVNVTFVAAQVPGR